MKYINTKLLIIIIFPLILATFAAGYFRNDNIENADAGATYNADINSDGVVNIFDLSILLSQWGTIAPNDCTATISPGDNLQQSLVNLKPGDTLCLNGGSYTGNINYTATAGSQASNITVKAASGQKPIIEGLFWVKNPDYWVFDGINVTWPATGATNTDHMVKITDGIGWVWKNSEISGAKSFAGMLIAGTTNGEPADWKLSNNCIHDTFASNAANQDHNIYVNTGLGAGNGLIERNVIHTAPNGENIKLAGATTATGTVNVTVRNNTLYSSSQNILIGGASDNILVENNIIYGAGPTNGNVRGFQLTGNNNIARNNVGGDANSFISNYSGGNGVTDGGGNTFPVNPNFDSLTCSVDGNGNISGFSPSIVGLESYGHLAN